MAACITHALYQDSLVKLLNCSMPESLNCLLLPHSFVFYKLNRFYDPNYPLVAVLKSLNRKLIQFYPASQQCSFKETVFLSYPICFFLPLAWVREAFQKKPKKCDKCHTCSDPPPNPSPPPPLSVTKNHRPFLVKNGLFRR